MGGGSSSQDKANQVNKQAYEQLKNQHNIESNQPNMNTKPNAYQNSPKVSPKQSPRNKHSFQQQKNSKINPMSPSDLLNNSNLSRGHQNNQLNAEKYPNQYQNDIVNQTEIRKPSRQDRQILQNIELSEKGQYRVGISLVKLTPDSKFPQFTNLQLTQSTNEATLGWNFDSKTKKWNFTLEKLQNTNFAFLANQRGQLLKGQEDKWALFNPSFEDNITLNQKAFYKEQFIKSSLQDNAFWRPSFQQLQKNKKSLCDQWKEESIDRLVQFEVQNDNNTSKVGDQIEMNNEKYKPYHQTRKYFQKDSDDWLLTFDVVQNQYKFHAFLTWKILPPNQNKNLLQILEKQKRILNLKQQIYIRKMKMLAQQ